MDTSGITTANANDNVNPDSILIKSQQVYYASLYCLSITKSKQSLTVAALATATELVSAVSS